MIDLHHLLEAAGVLVLGVLFYGYTYRWLGPDAHLAGSWRAALNGAGFGALAVVLMISRIQVGEGLFIDLRGIPLAVVGLLEGWPAGLVAGGLTAGYRWWLGGDGAGPGILAIVATVAVGVGARAWSGRRERPPAGLPVALGLAVFVITLGSFALLGPAGLDRFRPFWVHYLLGYVVGITALARFLQDVRERARLTAEGERFRAILDEASEAIRIVDAGTFRILESNRLDGDLSGYRREEMLGRDAREFWPEEPELRAVVEASWAQAGVTGFARAFALPYRTRAGRLIAVDSTQRIVEHGGRRYALLIYRDAADRQAAEAAQRDVAELRAVTMLAAAAAHEINNPLTVVVGALELLARQLPPGGEPIKWIERAVTAGRRIQQIVVRMNRITRVERAEAQAGLPETLDLQKSSEERT